MAAETPGEQAMSLDTDPTPYTEGIPLGLHHCQPSMTSRATASSLSPSDVDVLVGRLTSAVAAHVSSAVETIVASTEKSIGSAFVEIGPRLSRMENMLVHIAEAVVEGPVMMGQDFDTRRSLDNGDAPRMLADVTEDGRNPIHGSGTNNSSRNTMSALDVLDLVGNCETRSDFSDIGFGTFQGPAFPGGEVPSTGESPKDEGIKSLVSSVSKDLMALEMEQKWVDLERREKRELIGGRIISWTTNFIVLSNSIFLGIAEQERMTQAIAYSGPAPWVSHIDTLFAVLLGVELCTRLVYYKRRFFKGKEKYWNSFDLVLVLLGLVEQLFSRYNQLRAISALRALRVLRITRAFRSIPGLHTLRLMVAMVGSALLTCFWALVFLLLFIYMYAVWLMSLIVTNVQANPEDEAHHNRDAVAWRADAIDKFGNVGAAMNSLLESISGGRDWNEIGRIFLEVSVFEYMVFVSFIMFAFIAILNVITGIFVEHAGRVNRVDHDLAIESQLQTSQFLIESLKKIFKKACKRANKKDHEFLFLNDLCAHLERPGVIEHLQALDVNPTEALRIFSLVDKKKTGKVGIDEYVHALVKLEGAAKSLDMIAVMYELKSIDKALSKSKAASAQRFNDLERILEHGHRARRLYKQRAGAGTYSLPSSHSQATTDLNPKSGALPLTTPGGSTCNLDKAGVTENRRGDAPDAVDLSLHLGMAGPCPEASCGQRPPQPPDPDCAVAGELIASTGP